MCGVAGYRSNRAVAPEVLDRMVSALGHRGPDSVGALRDGDVNLAMCRLAINDLGGGDQPLYDENRSVALLYNGEIYNYPQLRRDLEAEGVVFRTNSDGEVICHLYRFHGEALFELLDGMFAAALWIASERKLILARDIPGEKPLYYAEPRPGEIVFASEIKGLRPFEGACGTIDRQALWDYPTFLWVPEPRTVFTGVQALPRGHILVHTRERTRMRRIVNRFAPPPRGPNFDETVAATRTVVEEAVRSRLLSDVPVGSFLSGGLDSSIVATLAARELPRLDTFSVGFEDVDDPYHGRADETAAAAATARAIGSRHHGLHVTARSFLDDLDRFCVHADQPFAVSSGLGILAVAKAAREAGIKVLLSGDGADENFGGYSWYAHLESGCKSEPARDSDEIVSFQNFGLPLDERLQALRAMTGPEKAWAWHYYAHEQEKSGLFADTFQEDLAPSLRYFDRTVAGRAWEPLDFIEQDRNFYFPYEMLTKVDRMTMAYSVEGRVPFAAPAVLAHAATLGLHDCIAADGTLKVALRRAFRDILPAEVVDRPKHGFNVPIDHWLKGEWSFLVEETFAPSSALAREGICAPDAGEKARAMLHDPRRLNGHTIFCFVMLNRWLELT